MPIAALLSDKAAGVVGAIQAQAESNAEFDRLPKEQQVEVAKELKNRREGMPPAAEVPPAVQAGVAMGITPHGRQVIFSKNTGALSVLSSILDTIGIRHITVTSETPFDIHRHLIANIFNGEDGRYGAALPNTTHGQIQAALELEAKAQESQTRHAKRALMCAIKEDIKRGHIQEHVPKPGHAVTDVSFSVDLIARSATGGSTIMETMHGRGDAIRSRGDAIRARGDAIRARGSPTVLLTNAITPAVTRFTNEAPWVLLTDTNPQVRPRHVKMLHVLDGSDVAEMASSLYARDDPHIDPGLRVVSHVSMIPPRAGDPDFDDGTAPFESGDQEVYTDGECNGADPADDPEICFQASERMAALGLEQQKFDFTGYLTIRTKTSDRKDVTESKMVQLTDAAGRPTNWVTTSRVVKATETLENVMMRKYDIFTHRGWAPKRHGKRTASERLMPFGLAAPKVVSCFDDTELFAPSDVTDGAVRSVRRTRDIPIHAHDVERALDSLHRFDATFAQSEKLLGQSQTMTVAELAQKVKTSLKSA